MTTRKWDASILEDLARKNRSAQEVQKLIHKLKYNFEPDGETLRSALMTYVSGRAHCLEASFLAAALLGQHGLPPLVLSLESDDFLDHVVFLFKQGDRWGSIGRSQHAGLQGRAPIFRTVRDLAWSYVDPYVDESARVSGWAVVDLDESQSNWRTSRNFLWEVEDFITRKTHEPLRASDQRHERVLTKYVEGIDLRRPYWW